MAKLVLTFNNETIGEFPLNKEMFTIGRKPGSDIRLDAPAISGLHAKIITIQNDSFLEDLNSTNGTFVNSIPVKKHVLCHDDIITLGEHRLHYVNEAAASTGFEKTMVINPNITGVRQETTSTAQQQTADENATQIQPAIQNEIPIGRLKVIRGNNSGQELTLNRALTTLGKPGQQIAVVTKRPQGYFIVHVDGDVYPYVNGESINIRSIRLNDHDVIEVADSKMEFLCP